MLAGKNAPFSNFENFIYIIDEIPPFVCGQTPSTTSTTTKQPSDNRTAVETSELKSIWPGESIKLIK
jgi:hypothetical protein